MKVTYKVESNYRDFDTEAEALECAKLAAAEGYDVQTVYVKTPLWTVQQPLPTDLVVTQVAVTSVNTGTTTVTAVSA